MGRRAFRPRSSSDAPFGIRWMSAPTPSACEASRVGEVRKGSRRRTVESDDRSQDAGQIPDCTRPTRSTARARHRWSALPDRVPAAAETTPRPAPESGSIRPARHEGAPQRDALRRRPVRHKRPSGPPPDRTSTLSDLPSPHEIVGGLAGPARDRLVLEPDRRAAARRPPSRRCHGEDAHDRAQRTDRPCARRTAAVSVLRATPMSLASSACVTPRSSQVRRGERKGDWSSRKCNAVTSRSVCCHDRADRSLNSVGSICAQFSLISSPRLPPQPCHEHRCGWPHPMSPFFEVALEGRKH